MKRIGLLTMLALMPALNPLLSQNIPVQLPGQDIKQASATSSIEGSYPQTVEWFNWISNEWQVDKTVTFTYASWGDPLNELWDYPTRNDKKITMAYNSNHLPTDILIQEKVGDVWVDKTRGFRAWDSYGQMTEAKQEHNVDGTWYIDFWNKTEYEMADGKVAKMTQYAYNESTADLKLSSRITYSYDNKGLLSKTFTETYTDSQWINSQNTYYSWNAQGKEDYIIIESWVETMWMKLYKTTFTWRENDSYDQITNTYNFLTQDFDNPFMRSTYNLDQHHNLIYTKTEVWSNGTWAGSYGWQYDITYEGNKAVQRITKMWDTTSGSFVNMFKEVFKNFINLGMEDPVTLSIRLDCYPNPVSNYLTLDYSAFGSSAWTIELMDMNGKKIKTANPELPAGRITWNIAKIPAGYYVVRMTDNLGRTITKSIVKQ